MNFHGISATCLWFHILYTNRAPRRIGRLRFLKSQFSSSLMMPCSPQQQKFSMSGRVDRCPSSKRTMFVIEAGQETCASCMCIFFAPRPAATSCVAPFTTGNVKRLSCSFVFSSGLQPFRARRALILFRSFSLWPRTWCDFSLLLDGQKEKSKCHCCKRSWVRYLCRELGFSIWKARLVKGSGCLYVSGEVLVSKATHANGGRWNYIGASREWWEAAGGECSHLRWSPGPGAPPMPVEEILP